MSFVPRAYQRRAMKACAEAYAAGHRRVLLVSPTGSGKTVMGAWIAHQFMQRRPTASVAWFAHRRELIRQAASTLERWGLEPGHSGLRKTARLQVASVSGALAREEVPEGDLGLFDEAHHFMADQWGLVMDSYGPDVPLYGLTATPERSDGRAMGGRFNHLIVVAQTSELVALWFDTEGREGLVPVQILRPSRPEKPGEIAKEPVDAYLDAGLRGRRNVVYGPTVQECERFARDFRAKGVEALVVHDKLATDERDRRLKSFDRGDVRVLINVHILTEGWDCPACEVVTIARRYGSIGPMIQGVGRGRRPCDGKELCYVLDLSGVTHILGDPDEDREYSLTGVGISRPRKNGPAFCLCGKPFSPDAVICPNCEHERDPAEELKTSGNPLEKFARFQQDTDRTRAGRLARWTEDAIARGWKPNQAMHRYKGTYGEMPSPRIMSQAHSIRVGRPWCVTCGHHIDRRVDGETGEAIDRCRCAARSVV